MHGLPQRVQGPDVLPVGEPDAGHALQPRRRRRRERGEGAPRRRRRRRRLLRRAARRVGMLDLPLRHELGDLPLELGLAVLQVPYLPQELLRCHPPAARSLLYYQMASISALPQSSQGGENGAFGGFRNPVVPPTSPHKKAPFINSSDQRAQSGAFCSFPVNPASKIGSTLLLSELEFRATPPKKRRGKNFRNARKNRTEASSSRSSLIPPSTSTGLGFFRLLA